jgi:CBS-domain-containing membrane protein
MAGGEQSPPRAKAGEIFSAWVGSCLAIACIALLERYATGNSGFPLLIGSFGASAVLAFGAIRSPLAQPRNLVGGHFLSALVGVSCYFLFPGTPWLASCLAVATAIALMHVTKTLHPPGGATALIAVTGRGGHPSARLSVRLRAVPARGADHARNRPYRGQHPKGAALPAIWWSLEGLRKSEKGHWGWKPERQCGKRVPFS